MSGYVFHGPLLSAHPGFEIVSVYYRTNRALTHPFKPVYNLDDVLSDGAVELVIVNTPNEHHVEHATLALDAGKHVLVEKPFTVTKAEAESLIALAAKRNRIITVFQNRRWDGDFLTVKKVVESGELGRIVEFECHYDRFRNAVDQTSWKEAKAKGTGVIYNLGSHMIDQVLTLFGMPEYVDARVGIQRRDAVVDDYYDIRLEYQGMRAIVKSSYLVREPGPRYMVHGDRGSFLKYGLDPQEDDLKAGKIPGADGWGEENVEWWGQLHTERNGQVVRERVRTIPGNYLAFYDNLYAAIRKGGALAVKPEQSMRVIEVIEAASRSSSIRQAVQLNA